MNKLQNYTLGKWTSGTGEGVPIHDAITGEIIALSDTKGLDFGEILQYGRKNGESLRKMTFQERGNMLKQLALHLTKRKEQFYEISYRTGATRRDSWIDKTAQNFAQIRSVIDTTIKNGLNVLDALNLIAKLEVQKQ